MFHEMAGAKEMLFWPTAQPFVPCLGASIANATTSSMTPIAAAILSTSKPIDVSGVCHISSRFTDDVADLAFKWVDGWGWLPHLEHIGQKAKGPPPTWPRGSCGLRLKLRGWCTPLNLNLLLIGAILEGFPSGPSELHDATTLAPVSWCRYSADLIRLRDLFPPNCCYFVVVGGLACLADPRGYASLSFDSW